MSNANNNYFNRFSFGERLQHFLLILTVTLLALTGLPQKFSSMDWAPVMVQMMGGIDFVRIIHRICAFILTIGVLYHCVSGVLRLITKRAKFEMLPRLKDFKDFGANIAYFMGLRKERPRFDRFNYIEKFEYWAVLWGMGVMAITGVILWFPTFAARFMPGLAIPAAKAAHSGEAFLAVTAVVLWHMYNAHFSPRVFPINKSMFTGKQSEHEIMVEHAMEYEKRTGEAVPSEVLKAPSRTLGYVLVTSGLVGVMIVSLFVALLYWSVEPPKPSLFPPMYEPLERKAVLKHSPSEKQVPTIFWEATGALPKADFDVSSRHITDLSNLPATIEFHDHSTGEVTSWLWDFGDGCISREPNPVHTYTASCPTSEERCTISLTVCGPGGCDTEFKPAYVEVTLK